jgi:hypothetical protein
MLHPKLQQATEAQNLSTIPITLFAVLVLEVATGVV